MCWWMQLAIYDKKDLKGWSSPRKKWSLLQLEHLFRLSFNILTSINKWRFADDEATKVVVYVGLAKDTKKSDVWTINWEENFILT